MTVKEGRFLTDRKVMRDNMTMDRLLDACFKLTDAGLYTPKEDGSFDWGEAFVGDRDYALAKIRVETRGHEASFAVVCEACEHRFQWEYDVDQLLDLNTTKIREDVHARLVDGQNEFESAEIFGRRFKFRLLRGKDLTRYANNRKKKGGEVNEIAEMLALRVLGANGEVIASHRKKIEMLEELSLGQLDELTAEFDKFDFGVDNDLEVECPECSEVQEAKVPFDRNFFFPKKKKSSDSGHTTN